MKLGVVASAGKTLLAGLVRAWRPDQGVTVGVNGISSVAGAWGTSVALTGTGVACPDVGATLAPNGSDLFDFTAADSEQFTMPLLSAPAFTFAICIAQKTQGSAQGLLGNSAAATQYLQLGAASTKIQLRAGAADANHDLTLPRAISTNLEVLVVTYDGTTAIPYIDGAAGAGVVMAGLTFAWDKIGALGASSNDLNAYTGAKMIFDRALSAAEVRSITNMLLPWKGQTVYAAASGSDSSTTPWLQATPILTVTKGLTFVGPLTELALKGGDVFRQAVKLSTSSGGTAAQLNRASGNTWGDVDTHAQIRFSTAPVLTNTAGTIYSVAGTWDVNNVPAGLDPGVDFGYIYYVPGGEIVFTDDLYNTTTDRLTYQAATTTPGVGRWSLDGTTVYVNAGVALVDGDIEVPVDGVVNSFDFLHDYWHTVGIDVCFSEDKGWRVFGRTGVTQADCGAFFNGSDGFDWFDDGVNLCRDYVGDDLVSCWNGRGPTIASGFGDGFSCHDTSHIILNRPGAFHNDKSGHVHQAPSVAVLNDPITYGSMCYRHADNAGQIGSMLARNAIAIVPAGALYPYAYSNTCTVDSPFTLEHFTAVSLSGGLEGVGVRQAANAAASIVARNGIITGFAIAVEARAGGDVTVDHNCLYGNTVNFTNVAAGAGNVLADPLFVDSPDDLTLEDASPCKGAGAALGVLTDLAGAARSALTPTLGAYE